MSDRNARVPLGGSDPGPKDCPSERQPAEVLERRRQAGAGALDGGGMCRVAVADRQRDGVSKMGAAQPFQIMMQTCGIPQTACEVVETGERGIPSVQQGDGHGRGVGVVGRLRAVHMVVGVDSCGVAGLASSSSALEASTSLRFMLVEVPAPPRTSGIRNSARCAPVATFGRRGDNGRGDGGIEDAKLRVRLGGRTLDA